MWDDDDDHQGDDRRVSINDVPIPRTIVSLEAAMPTYITVKAVAKMLSVSTSTVHRKLSAKLLRGKTIGPRITLVETASVFEYIATCPDR